MPWAGRAWEVSELSFAACGSFSHTIMAYLSDACQRGLIHGSWLDGASGVRPRMWSDAFSPVMIDGALRLPLVTRGKIEESATRRPSMPMTRHSGSTTLI